MGILTTETPFQQEFFEIPSFIEMIDVKLLLGAQNGDKIVNFALDFCFIKNVAKNGYSNKNG